jgi:hypothetical protein
MGPTITSGAKPRVEHFSPARRDAFWVAIRVRVIRRKRKLVVPSPLRGTPIAGALVGSQLLRSESPEALILYSGCDPADLGGESFPGTAWPVTSAATSFAYLRTDNRTRIGVPRRWTITSALRDLATTHRKRRRTSVNVTSTVARRFDFLCGLVGIAYLQGRCNQAIRMCVPKLLGDLFRGLVTHDRDAAAGPG